MRVQPVLTVSPAPHPLRPVPTRSESSPPRQSTMRPPARLSAVQGPGLLPAKCEHPPQVSVPHAVAGNVNDLSGVKVRSRAQCGCCVEQRHGLAHAAGPSQNYEGIGHRAVGNVLQDMRAVPQVVHAALDEQSVSVHPGRRVNAGGCSPPPRIVVGQDPPQFIVPHPTILRPVLPEAGGSRGLFLARGGGVEGVVPYQRPGGSHVDSTIMVRPSAGLVDETPLGSKRRFACIRRASRRHVVGRLDAPLVLRRVILCSSGTSN